MGTILSQNELSIPHAHMNTHTHTHTHTHTRTLWAGLVVERVKHRDRSCRCGSWRWGHCRQTI